MRIKHLLAAPCVALVLGVSLAACGSNATAPDTVQAADDYSSVTPAALLYNGVYYCVWVENRDACEESTDPNGSFIPELNWVQAADPGDSYSPDNTLLAMVIWSYFLGHQMYYTSHAYVDTYVPASRRSAYYSTWKIYHTRYARHLPRVRKQSQWTDNRGQIFTSDSRVKATAVQPPRAFNQRPDPCASGRPRSMGKANNPVFTQAAAFAVARPPVPVTRATRAPVVPPTVKSTPKVPVATATSKPSYTPPTQDAQPTHVVPLPNPASTRGGYQRGSC